MQMSKELCRSTHHVGAWIITLQSGAVEGLANKVQGLAKRSEPPENIIPALRAMKGKVIEHLPGPPAELEGHVQTWLHRMAKDIDHYTISKRLGIGRRPVVVLAYASKEQSPKSMDWGEIREHLLNCAGAALIFCKPAQARHLESRNRMVQYLAYAGLGAAIVLGSLGLFVAEHPPEPVEEHGSRASTTTPETASDEMNPNIHDAGDEGIPDAEADKGLDGGIQDGGNTRAGPQTSARTPTRTQGSTQGPKTKNPPATGTVRSAAGSAEYNGTENKGTNKNTTSNDPGNAVSNKPSGGTPPPAATPAPSPPPNPTQPTNADKNK